MAGHNHPVLLAVRLDSDFLIRTLEPFLTTSIIALAEGENNKIIASTSPKVILENIPLDLVEKNYLITGKTFFDYGASDLQLQMVSLISREEFDSMAMSLVAAGRRHRALTAFILAMSFAAIMIWLSSHIRKLTAKVSEFAEEDLGVAGRNQERGDELFILEKRFLELRQEIKNSHHRIERVADEKLDLERKNLEMRKERAQFELLQSVTEAIGVGVLEKTDEGARPANVQMKRFLEQIEDTSAFNFDEKSFEEKTLIDGAGEKKVFSLTHMGPLAGREVLLVQDITRRKKAEEALVTEKELMAATLKGIGDAVITMDQRGTITLFNKAAETITGWKKSIALGKQISEVVKVDNEKVNQRLIDLAAGVVHTDQFVESELRCVLETKSGEKIITAAGIAHIHDAGGNIIGVMVVRDITEKVRAEEEMLRAQKLESLGVLAGGIAHDFNNLLMSIMGNVSIAKTMLATNEPARQRLEETEKASLKATSLTQQLLTFSKGGEPIRRPLQISNLLKETANFTLSGANVKCEFDIAEELWPVEIDEGQISRVINNLIINAKQAMPTGGTIHVKCENVELRDEVDLSIPTGEYVKISVKDQGIGISEENLARIFDPYFSTKTTGSGLGLAAVFSIINKHEGRITVESKLGEGATFIIYLPVSRKLVEEHAKEDTLVKGRGRVLIMDDEEDVRDVAKTMLTILGYEAETARDGAEAVEMYGKAMEGKKPYDAVILDLTVPAGMGGLKAFKLIAELDPNARAIASSGYSNDPIMANHGSHGFIECAAKPYRIADLGRIMEKTLKYKDKNIIHNPSVETV